MGETERLGVGGGAFTRCVKAVCVLNQTGILPTQGSVTPGVSSD